MRTVEIIETADTNRQIHLTIPVDEASTRYRIKVSIEREPQINQREPATRLTDEWPPGFIERTFGGWKGELQRAHQGTPEERTPF